MYDLAMSKRQPPKGNEPEKTNYPVADKIQIILNGQVFEGVVKSVVEKTDGKKYNVCRLMMGRGARWWRSGRS
jgi:hypothetical protein